MSLANIKTKSQGFTIVELLIVVVVIAILAAITIVSYNGITNRANASAAASLASGLQKKAELFAADGPTAAYPRAITDLTGGASGTTNIIGTSTPAAASNTWYMTHGSVVPASSLTASTGKTDVIYQVCGHRSTTTAPTTIGTGAGGTDIITITGVSIQYFNYETGSGTKTISLGNATTSSGSNARGCVTAAA